MPGNRLLNGPSFFGRACRAQGRALLTIELGADITQGLAAERLLGVIRAGRTVGIAPATDGATKRRRTKAKRRRIKARRKIAAPGKSSTITTPHAVYAEPPVRGGANPGLGAAVCAVCNGTWAPTGPVIWAVTADGTPIHAGRCLRRYVTAKRLEGRQWWRIIDLGLMRLGRLGVGGARVALLAEATGRDRRSDGALKAAPSGDWS